MTNKNKDVTNPGEPIKTVFFDHTKLSRDKASEDDLTDIIARYIKTEIKNHSGCEDDYRVDADYIIELVKTHKKPTPQTELGQKVVDTIIRLHYCKTHWYYPWCAWWLLKAKYINPLIKTFASALLGKEELDRFVDRQLRSMQWTLKK